MALVNKGAAAIVKDAEAEEKLMSEAMRLVNDAAALRKMEKNIAPLGIDDADDRIVKEIFALVGRKKQA